MVILPGPPGGRLFIARRMTTRAGETGGRARAGGAAILGGLALRRWFACSSLRGRRSVLVGWLKPAVVLPVAALAGLSLAQIEALLAHELAHAHRHDYLVNLLQSFAEVVLFYHPAV